ncbi:MAG: type II methionyl aminopeptidase [Candidatus Methanomethylophilaceae archaeon]|nr:type II methionyl aminopeptidase [Candidatus Methanomethylophilaceae archaeon]
MLNDEQLDKLRKAGRISGEARELGMSLVGEGVKLFDVAQEVEGYIRDHGCGLAFPCNISINEVAAHYTPCCNDDRVFSRGDVVKIDCGAELDGFVGDTAGTVEVGTSVYTDLIESSKRARNTVAEFIGDGIPLCDIGRAVEMSMARDGFVPISNLCGHQIVQYNLHAGLSVPSYDNGDMNTIKSGMTVAVEPFATNGYGEVKNGHFGNIVRIARDKNIRDPKARKFLEYVKEEFKTFPFCARSCDYPDAEKMVKLLMRQGIFSGYAELVEVNGGIVSQHEYTFYIDGKRGEVTTLP